MPISRTYRCANCGHVWRFLHLTRSEPARPCPNGCTEKPRQELAAPAIGRGAKDEIAVPPNQAAREQLAADLALAGTGMTDINSHMKAGDIAAKPFKPALPAGLSADQERAVARHTTPNFQGVAAADWGQRVAAGASDPTRARNNAMLFGDSPHRSLSPDHFMTQGKKRK